MNCGVCRLRGGTRGLALRYRFHASTQMKMTFSRDVSEAGEVGEVGLHWGEKSEGVDATERVSETILRANALRRIKQVLVTRSHSVTQENPRARQGSACFKATCIPE